MKSNGIAQLEIMDIFEDTDHPFKDGLSLEAVKLEKIRRVSNIVQAIENLIIQCEDVEEFEELQAWAKRELNMTLQQLRFQIHKK